MWKRPRIVGTGGTPGSLVRLTWIIRSPPWVVSPLLCIQRSFHPVEGRFSSLGGLPTALQRLTPQQVSCSPSSSGHKEQKGVMLIDEGQQHVKPCGKDLPFFFVLLRDVAQSTHRVRRPPVAMRRRRPAPTRTAPCRRAAEVVEGAFSALFPRNW